MERMFIVILLIGVSFVEVNAFFWQRRYHQNNNDNSKVSDVSTEVDKKPSVVEEKTEDPEEAVKETKDKCAVKNVALHKHAEISSLYEKASTADLAVDGNLDQRYHDDHKAVQCFHTQDTDNNWWYVDLGKNYILTKVILYNRDEDCCIGRANNLKIQVGETLDKMKTVGKVKKLNSKKSVNLKNKKGRFVKIVQTVKEYFHLCEVEVFGKPEICDMPNRCQNGGIVHPDTSERGYRCECPEVDNYMFRGQYCEESWVRVPKGLSNALARKAESEYPIDQH